MHALLINNETKFLKNLKEFLSKKNITFNVKHYKEIGEIKEEEYDFIVLSGGPISIERNRDLEKEKEIIKKTKLPLFGICAGFQIICHVEGEEILQLKEYFNGLQNTNYAKNNVTVYKSHGWAIKEIKNQNYNVLGSSKEGIEIIEHKTRPIMATQFHPEITTPENQGEIIFDKFLSKHLKN